MNQFEHDIAPTDIAENNIEKPRNIKIDEAIKHLFSSEKQALIRFINSALGESYDINSTELVELNTEFILHKTESDGPDAKADSFDLEKIMADMIFSLNGVAYHIEFQTTADQTIVIRIIGYGVEHALMKLRSRDIHDALVFELPVPVLIQIDEDDRLTDKIPVHFKFSGQEDTFPVEITVVKLWKYDVDALIERGFYLLLPFLLVRYRKGKKTVERAEALLSDLK